MDTTVKVVDRYANCFNRVFAKTESTTYMLKRTDLTRAQVWNIFKQLDIEPVINLKYWEEV